MTDRPLHEGLRRWRGLIEAGAIQSIGSAAALLITIMLAHVGGPEVQGSFGLAKAELDFLTSLCLIGLPQAAFYYCQRGDLSVSAARRLAVFQAGLAGSAIVLWKAPSLAAPGVGVDPYVIPVGYALAVAATVSYSTVRGVSLAYRSSREFAAYSAAPSLLLLGVVALILVVAANWRAPQTDVALAFAVSYGLCAVIGCRWLLPTASSGSTSLSITLVRRLVRYGGATWLAGLNQAACAYLALHWIARQAGGIESAGVFSAALALVLIAITPINLVIPILFKNWAGASAQLRNREFVEIAAVVAGGAAAAALIMALKGDQVVGFVFGAQYAFHTPVFVVLCLTVFPQSLSRLWGVFCNAIGRPGLAVGVEAFRLFVLASGLLAAGTSLNRIAWIWLVADLSALGLGLVLGSRVRVDRAVG